MDSDFTAWLRCARHSSSKCFSSWKNKEFPLTYLGPEREIMLNTASLGSTVSHGTMAVPTPSHKMDNTACASYATVAKAASQGSLAETNTDSSQKGCFPAGTGVSCSGKRLGGAFLDPIPYQQVFKAL